MLPLFSDFLSPTGLIAAFSILLGSAIGIHGLQKPRMSKARRRAQVGYAVLAVLGSLGVLLISAYDAQHSRETAKKIDTIAAILDSAPGISGEEALNHIIGKFSQPQGISQPQMATMAHLIESLKDILPKKIIIVRAQVSLSPGYDNAMYLPLVEMFKRNAIDPEFDGYKPSLHETGFLLITKDPLNPPEYVAKFLSALELTNIKAKTAYIPAIYREDALTIFIGPPPI